MTLFDVRLGWWLGNPRKKKWTRGSPDLGFWCLLQELFGAASDDSDYVYLSDGGHFENLALYELCAGAATDRSLRCILRSELYLR